MQVIIAANSFCVMLYGWVERDVLYTLTQLLRALESGFGRFCS
jgi:hypothetical protein